WAAFGNLEAFTIKGDYVDAKMNIGEKVGLKYFLSEYINAEINVSNVTIENTDIIRRNVFVSEVNLEYLMIPKVKLSPFVYAGAGTFFLPDKPRYKAQVGGGLEYRSEERRVGKEGRGRRWQDC